MPHHSIIHTSNFHVQGSSKFLVLGGEPAYSDSEIVTIGSSSSNSSDQCPKPADNIYGSYGQVGAVMDGRPLVCGGFTAPRTCNMYVSWPEGHWTIAAFTIWERVHSASEVLPNGTFFVTGGMERDFDIRFATSARTSETLDPGAIEFDGVNFGMNENAFSEGPELPEVFLSHCMTGINGSHVFVAGGGYKGRILCFHIEYLLTLL